MITYPIPEELRNSGRWYLHDTNTGQTAKIAGTGNWPVADGTEIPGLEAHLVPLLAVSDDKPTNIDERLNRLIGEVQPPDIANNELRTTWKIEARTDQEKLDVIDNIERQEAGKHFENSKLLHECAVILGALLRANKGLNIPQPLQDAADSFQARSQKLYKNKLKVDSMRLDVAENREPVLDQEFESVD